MKKFITSTVSGILAGIMIIIGCSVYLACESKVVGAVFFSVALLTICYKGFSLYTGRIGFLLSEHNKDQLTNLLAGLLGNVIGTFAFGFLVGYALPSLKQTAMVLAENKLSIEFLQTLIRGTFCGILMYVAVSVYKENKTVVGIIFCIPVFILCGFEHSVADMGYFAIAGHISLKAFGFIMTVVLGNTIGALIFPALKLIGKDKKKNEEN